MILFEIPYYIQNTIAVDYFRTELKKKKKTFSQKKKKNPKIHARPKINLSSDLRSTEER